LPDPLFFLHWCGDGPFRKSFPREGFPPPPKYDSTFSPPPRPPPPPTEDSLYFFLEIYPSQGGDPIGGDFSLLLQPPSVNNRFYSGVLRSFAPSFSLFRFFFLFMVFLPPPPWHSPFLMFHCFLARFFPIDSLEH